MWLLIVIASLLVLLGSAQLLWQLAPRDRLAWLLAPVCPLLGWGPLTHTYFNHRACRTFLATDPPADHPVARLLRKPQGALAYVQHSIDPDVIKTYSFLYKQLHFEYAHNPLPNRYAGHPAFGQALWRAAKTDDERLMALGWISHQIADQFAHNLPFDRFFGYVNREAYFGYYWDEVMYHLGMEHHEGLGGAFFTADHWVTELIIDAYTVGLLGEEYDPAYVLGRRRLPYPLLEQVAPAYIKTHTAILAADYYDEPQPVRIAKLPRCREFADLVNAGTYHYVRALLRDYGTAEFRAVVDADPKFVHLSTMLDLVTAQVAAMLADPAAEYQPVQVDGAMARLPEQAAALVAPSPLEADAPGWWSERMYAAYKAHRPHPPGLLQRILQVLPLAPLRWLVATFPLTAMRGPIARALLPRGYSNLALAMHFAWRLREGHWRTFPEAMEDVLQARALLSPEPRLRLRTF